MSSNRGQTHVSSLIERDAAVIAGVEKLRFFDLAIESGEGCYVHSADGRRLLDLSGSWAAASLGYGHPKVVEAVADAVRRMPGASILSAVNPDAVALAERLLEVVPGQDERRVWLGHAGSDATEAAVRAVEAATGRSGFISFLGAYHGGTIGSMEVSGHTAQRSASKRADLIQLPFPDPYRMTDDAAAEVLATLDSALSDSRDVAALLVEPIQSDAGVIVPPAGFLGQLADRCRVHGIFLVADEVKVGVGRTGVLNAFEHEGIVPDIVLLGKGLGGGLPISAVIGPADVLDVESAFAMLTTAGNPVTAGAARAVIETITHDRLWERAAAVGGRLRGLLEEMSSDHDMVGDVRGRGLAIGIDLVVDRATKEPSPEGAAKVAYRLNELGAIVYYVGTGSNVLELTPPLMLTDADADLAVELLDRALGDVQRGEVSDEAVAAFAGW